MYFLSFGEILIFSGFILALLVFILTLLDIIQSDLSTGYKIVWIVW